MDIDRVLKIYKLRLSNLLVKNRFLGPDIGPGK